MSREGTCASFPMGPFARICADLRTYTYIAQNRAEG